MSSSAAAASGGVCGVAVVAVGALTVIAGQGEFAAHAREQREQTGDGIDIVVPESGSSRGDGDRVEESTLAMDRSADVPSKPAHLAGGDGRSSGAVRTVSASSSSTTSTGTASSSLSCSPRPTGASSSCTGTAAGPAVSAAAGDQYNDNVIGLVNESASLLSAAPSTVGDGVILVQRKPQECPPQPLQLQHQPPAPRSIVVSPITAISSSSSTTTPTVPGMSSDHAATTHSQATSARQQHQQQQNLQCLVTVLTRPSTSDRWGLQISLFETDYLILGSADYGQVRRLTTFGTVQSWRDGATSSGDGFSGGLQSASAAIQPPPPSSSAATSLDAGGLSLSTPSLQAGDLIRSLNSRPISSFGGSLDLITAYLRIPRSVKIVALRCRDSMVASATALVNGGRSSETRIREGVRLSAQGSYKVMRNVLRLSSGNSAYAGSGSGSCAGRSSTAMTAPSAPGGTVVAHGGRYNYLYTTPYARPARAEDYGPIDSKRVRLFLNPEIERDFGGWLKKRKATWREKLPQAASLLRQQVDYDPLDGARAHLYLNPEIERDFGGWLTKRKATWRENWPQASSLRQHVDYDPLDGTRANLYLNPEIEQDFSGWLKTRKATWREGWPVAQRVAAFEDDDEEGEYGLHDDASVAVRNDFWAAQGYETFQQWLASSKAKWAQDYSWHRAKRRKIEHAVDVVVRLPTVEDLEGTSKFATWLDVRKNQWRLLTRKRQRKRAEEEAAEAAESMAAATGKTKRASSPSSGDIFSDTATDEASSGLSSSSRISSPNSVAHNISRLRPHLVGGRSTSALSTEIAVIDSILEEEELRRQELSERDPLDISFIFDSSLGAPDDTVSKILSYLPVSEHWKFLCISYTTSMAIRQRDYMWRSLCPTRWALPRRPRVPWYKFYVTKIRVEEETYRKQSDELLCTAYAIIEKADHLQKMQKLVKATRKKFDFDVNYTSGIVCERNSLLNLSVINGRHKIARFLVESELANIETVDRGNFSPLLNAAWLGDKPMVRYLMSRGANRALVGMYHSSKGICPADFKGRTAEGWARERGFTPVADLIRLGL